MRWQTGHAVIEAAPAIEATLVEFFLERYCPTPILSPWNSRGGFRRDRRQGSERILAELEATTGARLEPLRDAVRVARDVWQRAADLGLVVEEVVPPKAKPDLVELCRAWFPDAAVRWLDAAAVLTDDGPVYPALLGGTGGNLGSGDLSANYIEQVLVISGERAGRTGLTAARREELLVASLFRSTNPTLGRALVGQFDPGGTGGVNMPGGGGDAIVNPWDLVLGLEGALLFAAGTARRLASDGSRRGAAVAAMPFTVRPAQGTARSMAERENTRAELWMPEWHRPLRLAEVEHLLAEGRAQWGRRQALDGVDFVRAVASLGVDRSIAAFTRYLVAERLGQSNLAVPVGRIVVREHRAVDLLHEVDPWLGRVPAGDRVPRSITTPRNQANAAMFDVAQTGRATALHELLEALAALERAVSRSPDVRERLGPLFLRHGGRWLVHLDDGSPEFEIALALASQNDALGPGEPEPQARRLTAFRLLVRPVELDPTARRLRWAATTPAPGLGTLPLDTVLRRALERRALRGEQPSGEELEVVHMRGIDVAYRYGLPASLETVRLLQERVLDVDRIGRLTAGLCLLDWSGAQQPPRARPQPGAYDPAWALLAPFFHRRPIRVPAADPTEPDRQVRFLPTMPLVAAVTRGDVGRACELAARRLAQYGIDPAVRPSNLSPSHHLHSDVLAALSVPLAPGAVEQLIRQIDPRDRTYPSPEIP
jgi:CRISPR-associated protein Csx17